MNPIGGNTGLGRSNMDQALRAMQQRIQNMQPGESAPKTSFDGALANSVLSLDKSVKATENMHLEALQGELDFHEVAAKVKEAQLSFDFAMKVRNKFINAYTEVMRMNV